MANKKRIDFSYLLITPFAVFWLILTIAPIIFIVLNSFKQNMEFFMGKVWGLPENFSFDNYSRIIDSQFHQYFFNSILVTFVSLIILLLAGSAASFGLSRIRFKFHNFFYFLFIIGLTIPVHITLIPVYVTTRKIGLYDSLWSLPGPFIAHSLPITIFILVAFMGEIPKSLEEASYIEGATKRQAFQYIILPLTKPALVTVGLFGGVSIWNDFVFPLILINTRENRPLTLAIWDFQGEFGSDIPAIMAALFLTMLPLFMLYAIAKEKIMEGLIAGAIKG
ncbi:MAG: carbohydrate ABC transporter permease [SAR324 cluster bacterium]|nr:carbohydrate ABC transporter permease [SAR324 cluster bacterium]